MGTLLDDLGGVAATVVGRVLVSTRFTPAYEVPISKPRSPSPGEPGGSIKLVKQSTAQLIQPTVRVWFSGSDQAGAPDYVVAPYGEADGSWAGPVILGAMLILTHAIAFAAGSATR